jgi:hypothetical protein
MFYRFAIEILWKTMSPLFVQRSPLFVQRPRLLVQRSPPLVQRSHLFVQRPRLLVQRSPHWYREGASIGTYFATPVGTEVCQNSKGANVPQTFHKRSDI